MTKKKDIPVKIFQGGSTGLVQQKLKSYPPKSENPKEEHEYISIKDNIKKQYDIDIVCMAGGPKGYNVVDEDSELLNKEFEWGYSNKNVPYHHANLKYSYMKYWIKEFKKKDIKYAFLNVIPDTKPVMREVVASSDSKLIGKKF